LEAEKVNTTTLESYLKKQNPKLVALNGHGGPDVVYGQDHKPLIKADQNLAILKDRIIHVLACNAGKVLGPACIKSGTKAWLGYKRKFLIPFDKNKYFIPLEDNLAASALEPALEVVRSLIKGNTVRDAFNNSQRAFAKSIAKLLLSTATLEENSALFAVFHDMENQISLGDQSAVFGS
jgi:hypothetical protein